MQGMAGFDAYMGSPSMYEVHKFMNLNHAENTYFIQQVGMAAASFGVTDADVNAVGESLDMLFNVRCGPPTAVTPHQGKQLQSICINEETCPLAKDAMCDAYGGHGGNGTMTPTSGMPSPTESMEPTTETMGPTSVPTDGASVNGFGVAALAVGLAAFVL